MSRRIAFDLAKGRLWALCSRCRNWNLAPIEERWEVVEEAERLFEDAAVLSSTDNVTLGRLASGTELVRIGRVKRRELAGWRYGDRLLRRWRRYRGARKAAPAMFVLGAMTAGLPAWALGAAAGIGVAWVAFSWARPIARAPGGRIIRSQHGVGALLLPASTGDGWSLALARRSSSPPWKRVDPLIIHGGDALRVLRAILPKMNSEGGTIDQVWHAVGELNRLGSPDRVLREAAVSLKTLAGMDTKGDRARYIKPHRLFSARPEIRLALEMAANEETERRALEGELALLVHEWKEAEELASVADDLLFPRHLREKLSALKASRARATP